MRAVATAVNAWPDRAWVLIRVVEHRGFGARRGGEALAVAADGERAGEIVAGVLDAQLDPHIDAVRRAGSPAIVEVTVPSGAAAIAGLTCGGTARVLLEPANRIPDTWWAALVEGPAALVSELQAPHNHLVVTPTEHRGQLASDEHARAGIDRARRALSDGRVDRFTEILDGLEVLVDAYIPVRHLLVVGSGDLAVALCAQGRLLGWDCTNTFDLGDSLDAARAIGPAACLVVLSHDGGIDAPVLAAAMNSQARYLGGLGSRRTQHARAERLRSLGVDDAAIASIHGPVGLDLGATSPSETALAICAEILAATTGRPAVSLRDRPGPIHAMR